MKRIFSIVMLLTISTLCLGQEGEDLSFTETIFNFGEVNEEDGPITHEFEFVNNGTSPLVISNVKASCGCTTPGWSKEPVMPGEKGFVKAQYNPMNRPGAFKKSLTITSNASNPRTVIYIQGKVKPRIKSTEEELRVKTGSMRIKSKTVNMGRVTTEKSKSRSIDVYNDSDRAFSFRDETVGAQFVTLSFEPKTLEPKQKGKINIDFNPNFEDNLGFQNHNVRFFTDESEDNEKELNVMATITEYFPPMTEEEKALAPVLSIEKRLVDLGKIQQNTQREVTFELVNSGKSKLNIRKVVSNCNCLTVDLSKTDIRGNKSAKLTATFDSSGRKGNQIKSITIYSNDPMNPTQVVTVKGQVEHSVQ